MKKIKIVTINDNNNYGNRLQNYALQHFLLNLTDCDVYTDNTPQKISLKKMVKTVLNYSNQWKKNKREKNFKKFNKLIKYSDQNDQFFDYFIVGSDQVWNPNFGHCSERELLTKVENEKKISYAASFGVSKLNSEYEDRITKELNKFNHISVREESAKNIIEKLIKNKKIYVNIDPTMLLTAEDWDKISKRPKMLNSKKYILNYFLGTLSEQRKKEISRIAKDNECEIIDILDEKSPYYECGPDEFLYLEKNAFLICTDSFHSSVFAVIYNKPFIIFDREDKEEKMNSRLDTLISKLDLKNRRYNNKSITEENLKHNYEKAYKLLELERKKSIDFLKKALEINKK